MKLSGRFALLVSLCTLLSGASAQNPISFQIKTDHTGALYSPGMDPPLSLRWSVYIGGTASYPVIVGNKVFVIAAGSPSTLYALDAQTGHILWDQPTPQGIEGGWIGAAYENGMLFLVPSSAYDGAGAMYAFSAVDGHQIWSALLPGQYAFSSAPTARNGIVYTSGAGDGGTVYAVRESDGALLWTEEVENGDSSAPAVTSDGVYVSYACPQTYKFDPTTGRQIWHYSGQCEGGGGDSVAIYQNLVYVRDLYNYPTDGITLSTGNGVYLGGFNSKYSPAFWQDTAFYTEQYTLTAVNLNSSQTLWTAQPNGGDSFACAPIVVNGVVYTGTEGGNLYGYAYETGNRVFSASLGAGVSCSEYSNIPLPGLNAADGLLVVPAGGQVEAFQYNNFGKWQFTPVTPCRLVDTRQGIPIQGGTSQNFEVPSLGGCNIPASATAYSLNVTVSPHGRLGYLTIWPTGEDQPTVSTMNSPDGRVKANAAIVPAGLSDEVSVYVSNTSDVILDIDGYFTAPAQGSLQFYPLAPCRVVDTRNGSNQPQGLGPPSFGAMETRELPILSKSPCLANLPNQPLAYSFNVTASPYPNGQQLSYLTAWPSNEPQPTVSTLNNPTATTVANAAIVPAAPNGDISVFTHNSTDVIIDINGYFAAPGTGGLSLYPATPCRAYDSRSNNGQPFSGQRNLSIVDSQCGPPAAAQAYVFNATVVPPGPLGYLTLWPDGEPQPVVSTLNARDGFITSNMAIVPNANGTIDAYASAPTQLILDISGYFAP